MRDVSYTYTTLRYVHDVATAEFVNVGVALVAPEVGFVGARFRTRPGRLSDMFSDFNRRHFQKTMRSLDQRFQAISGGQERLFYEKDARLVAEEVLPQDDTAYQWSPLGSGVACELGLEETLERTFQRLVTHHERTRERESRSDRAVWSSFRRSFSDTKRLSVLSPKTVSSASDSIQFQHAWENGQWHCLEALSLDLQRPTLVCQKAHLWLGRLTSLADTEEQFKVYFLVGEPSNPTRRMMNEYQRAIGILRKIGEHHEVVPEAERATFAQRIQHLLPEPQPREPGPLFAASARVATGLKGRR